MSTIDERMKITCGVCGVNWPEHPENDTCWRHRPKPEPIDMGGGGLEATNYRHNGTSEWTSVTYPQFGTRKFPKEIEHLVDAIHLARTLTDERDDVFRQARAVEAERDVLARQLVEARGENARLRAALALRGEA